MKKARKRAAAAAGAVLLSPLGFSQVPDTLTSIDPGGRSHGMGGFGYFTGSDTFSSYFNPAGLGYIERTQAALAFRNMPESRTAASGDFADPTLVSNGESGAYGLSHVGIAFPWRGGAVGLALTLGGYMDDTRTGNGLQSGTLQVNDYRERIKARTDFLSLGYGKSSPDMTFSWGVSLLYAIQGITNVQTGGLYDGNTQVGVLDVDNNETGSGFGVVAGVQFSPRNQPNMSIGFSFRSEIDLTNNTNTSSVYDKIPGRIGAGIALRRDGLRSGRDFLVYGAEVQHFFGGGSSPILDRDSQTVGSIGLEYNYVAGFGRLPIRIGFQGVPSGGFGFGSRNTVTYGIGYRPAGSDLSIDLNFGRPEGGGSDISLSVGFRFN